jgi:glycosyltransferase involved in cell wall biosynthesis
MRITSLSVSDRLGGSEIALVGMIGALQRLHPDWRVQVVLPGDGPLRERLRDTAATCSVVPMPAALAGMGEWSAVEDGWSARSRLALGVQMCSTASVLPAYESRLARTVAEFQPDLIHTNGLKAHVLGARLPDRNVPIVWHLHEYISRRRLTRWLLRRYASRCSTVIANSFSVATDVSSSLGAWPPVRVVPNSVDLTAFSPQGPRLDLDRAAGLSPGFAGVLRIGLVATYGRWKGHEIFLDAMQRTAHLQHLRGYIVGGPLYETSNSQLTRTELQSMIDARQLTGRVGLTGFVEAAPAMRALDVVVHASTEPEPFGLVIAEAMACGRALITTAYGGAAELISDRRDALVAETGDPRALADAIETLAGDADLRGAMGARARETARLRFAPEAMAAHISQAFENAASRPPVGEPA